MLGKSGQDPLQSNWSTEHCLQAAQDNPPTDADAEALKAAVKSMRSILNEYARHAPELGSALPTYGSLQISEVRILLGL